MLSGVNVVNVSMPQELTCGGKQKTVRMHRVIMNTPDDMDTDHVDGDTLFNLECNLRVCSTAENARNRGKSKNNTSGYKGVYWHKRIGKWSACLRYYGKLLHLGYYDIPEDAARAYDERAKELHGEFAVLNFQQLQGLV